MDKLAEDIARWRIMRANAKELGGFMAKDIVDDIRGSKSVKVNSPEFLLAQRGIKDRFTESPDTPKKEAKHTALEAKYKPHLVTEEFIQAVAEVRAYGVKKYGHEDGWQITDDRDYLDAAARHINKTIAALQHGSISELYDLELKDDKLEGSGLLNLAHAACDIMFIITKIQNNQSELYNNIKAMEDMR